MKRKVWVSSPVFFILAASLFLMAGASWFWNRAVFAAEISLAVLSCALVSVLAGRFSAHVSAAVKSARNVLTGDQYRALKEFRIPVAVVGTAGDIIWVNDAFLSGVNTGRECRGENVLKFIYPKTLQQILDANGTDITVSPKQFTVFGVRNDTGSVLYFIEDTYYKEINREYMESRPVVALAHFDNREELARNISESEDARITAEVEEQLIAWAQNMGGFMKKLENGRYFILTDEAHTREAMSKRFPLLDSVRAIKSGERLNATVSLGVARGAKTLQEADTWARKALDMALGRGGDQVAVRQENDTYAFFGGLSKAVEKRDKVRTRVFAATLSDDIKDSDTVLIMGHKYSDLDCIGAAVGMWTAASKALKKQTRIVVTRDQSMASLLIKEVSRMYKDEVIFISPQEAAAQMTPKSLLMVLDTHSREFVESAELLDIAARIVVIDHHRMMVRHIENALVFYHEPYASSTSEMVTELVQYIGDRTLTELEAEALLAGIMLDTKNFVLKTGVRTFEAAAYLRRKGADTVKVKRMFSDSIEAYKAKYRIVTNAEILGNCAVASSEKEFPEIRIASAQAADELLSIQGVEASFVVFPAGGAVNISARSLGDINVQLIMEDLGGGGHLTMAGAQLSGLTVAQAYSRLIEAIRRMREQATKPKN